MNKMESIGAVIDVGTSKLRVSLGQQLRKEPLEILATAAVNNDCYRQGIVIDIRGLTEIIREAIAETEKLAGLQIRNVDVAFGGAAISGINTSDRQIVKNRVIEKEALLAANSYAKKVGVDDQYLLLHALLQDYQVDEHEGIFSPEGMIADSFEVRMHLIRAKRNDVDNIIKCVEASGVGVNRIVFSGLASAYAVMNDVEKELGACVIDIGAGTTDFALYQQNKLYCSGGINVGGGTVSSDLAAILMTPRNFAEQIKKEDGCLYVPADTKEFVQIPSTGHRESKSIKKSEICNVISARYHEIFSSLGGVLYQSGVRNIGDAGMILTGGGAEIPCLAEYISDKFKVSARVAAPEKILGMPENLQYSPQMSTTVGMFRLLSNPIKDGGWDNYEKTGIMKALVNKLKRQV